MMNLAKISILKYVHVLLQPIFNIFVCMYACIYDTFCMLECVDTDVPEIPTMFTQVWI